RCYRDWSSDLCSSDLSILDHDSAYLNRNPKCEPQLGRRGLYRATGGHQDERVDEIALLWVLNFSDGRHTLLDIAERAGVPFEQRSEERRVGEAGVVRR